MVDHLQLPAPTSSIKKIFIRITQGSKPPYNNVCQNCRRSGTDWPLAQPRYSASVTWFYFINISNSWNYAIISFVWRITFISLIRCFEPFNVGVYTYTEVKPSVLEDQPWLGIERLHKTPPIAVVTVTYWNYSWFKTFHSHLLFILERVASYLSNYIGNC